MICGGWMHQQPSSTLIREHVLLYYLQMSLIALLPTVTLPAKTLISLWRRGGYAIWTELHFRSEIIMTIEAEKLSLNRATVTYVARPTADIKAPESAQHVVALYD